MLEIKEKFREFILERRFVVDEQCIKKNDEISNLNVFLTPSDTLDVLKEYDRLELFKYNFSGVELSLYQILDDRCVEMAYGWNRISEGEKSEELIEYIESIKYKNDKKIFFKKKWLYQINFSSFFMTLLKK